MQSKHSHAPQGNCSDTAFSQLLGHLTPESSRQYSWRVCFCFRVKVAIHHCAEYYVTLCLYSKVSVEQCMSSDAGVSPSVVEGEEEHAHDGFPGDVDPWHLGFGLGECRTCSSHPHHGEQQTHNTQSAHASSQSTTLNHRLVVYEPIPTVQLAIPIR